MVLYELVLALKCTGANTQVHSLLRKCAEQLWSRGAVITDISCWGSRELAYRIRKHATNHYHARYLSLWTHCAPPALRQVENTLRTSDVVLRWMSLRRPHVRTLSDEVIRPGAHELIDPPDLAANAAEAAKYEYRNLVLQRVFDGKPKNELLADQLTRHRLAYHGTGGGRGDGGARVTRAEHAPPPGAGATKVTTYKAAPTGPTSRDYHAERSAEPWWRESRGRGGGKGGGGGGGDAPPL